MAFSSLSPGNMQWNFIYLSELLIEMFRDMQFFHDTFDSGKINSSDAMHVNFKKECHSRYIKKYSL